MSVKIWVYHIGGHGDGMVRLKLKPGAEPLRTWSGGKTDEGWATREEKWWVEDGLIMNQIATDGVDCDGRSSTCNTFFGDVSDRHAFYNEYTGYLLPEWSSTRSSQRDYSAEAAGY